MTLFDGRGQVKLDQWSMLSAFKTCILFTFHPSLLFSVPLSSTLTPTPQQVRSEEETSHLGWFEPFVAFTQESFKLDRVLRVESKDSQTVEIPYEAQLISNFQNFGDFYNHLIYLFLRCWNESDYTFHAKGCARQGKAYCNSTLHHPPNLSRLDS